MFVALTFVLAGIVEGVTQTGLPTLVIGLLGLSMAPAKAAALLVVPSLVTNVWQFATGRHRVLIMLRKMWPMLLTICLATWSSAGLIAGNGGYRAATALGTALVIYGLLGLARFQMTVSHRVEPWLSPVIGAATGVVTGATGVFVIPAVPYLQSLGLEKEELLQVLGLSFTASTVGLAAGLASHGKFHLAAVGTSLVCTVPALAGTLLGHWVRGRIDPATFRRPFFIGLLFLGGDLMLRS